MSKKKIIILCAIPIVIVCSCLVFFVITRDNSVPASTNKEATNNTIDNSIYDVTENTIDNKIDNTEVLINDNTTESEENVEQKPIEKPSKNTNNQNSNINTSTNNTNGSTNINTSTNTNTNVNTNTNIPSTPSDSQDNISQDNQDSSSAEPQKPITPSIPEVIITYYGDANEDGILDIADASTIKRHLEGNNTLSGQALKNADINADGKVNNVDAVLLQGALAKIYSHQITKPLTNYVLYGDANEDGILDIADASTIKRHLEGNNTLSGQTLKNADINADGKVNNVDAVLLQGALAKIYSHQITKPLTNYVLYGDANEDGKIDIADSITIKMHVEGSNVLKGQALKNADVNNDGNVDKTDATLVQEFLASIHPNTLPNKPII